jgi:hypothetical protein
MYDTELDEETIHTVATADAAFSTFEEQTVDCLISEYDLNSFPKREFLDFACTREYNSGVSSFERSS